MIGAWISVSQAEEEKNLLAGSKDKTKFIIELLAYGSDHKLITEPAQDWCSVNFDRAVLRVSSDKSTSSTVIEVRPEGADEWIPCISTNTTSIDYLTRTQITTGGTEILRASSDYLAS